MRTGSKNDEWRELATVSWSPICYGNAGFEPPWHRELFAAAGYPAIDWARSWPAFAEHRAKYASRLNLLASYLATPPTQWIGDRTILLDRHAGDHF
ncbi:MAG: hypothetical protein HY288_18940 [Planctomycetia bacterium]|nr:hypothetical protein [Planctomycetia bacterium]